MFSRGFQGFLASVQPVFRLSKSFFLLGQGSGTYLNKNQAFFLFLLGPNSKPREFQAPSVELRGFHETLEPSHIRPFRAAFGHDTHKFFFVVELSETLRKKKLYFHQRRNVRKKKYGPLGSGVPDLCGPTNKTTYFSSISSPSELLFRTERPSSSFLENYKTFPMFPTINNCRLNCL